MVRPFQQYIALFIIAFVSPNLGATTRLSLQLNATEVEQGHYLQAELHGLNLGRDLSQIDLSPLTPLFGVHVVETATVTEGERASNIIQRMLLRLYPRQTGHLSIPAILLDDLSTMPTGITVTPAVSNNLPITISTHHSATQVWQRQQVIIEVELKTTEPFVTLQADESALPGIEALPLPVTQETRQGRENQANTFHLQWILYPQTSGDLSVELPPLKYATGGMVDRVFHLPIIHLHVKALPPYIPPTIPVGKVSVKTQLDDQTIYTTDKTATWEITLQSTELLPQWLPPVLRQIHSTDSVEFMQPNSERTQLPDNRGPHGQVVHRIPFKPRSTGVFTLPNLRVQYFDPESGRLVTVKSVPQSVYAISPLWMFILVVLVITIVTILSRKFGKILIRYRQRRRLRQQALQWANMATNPRELRKALKEYGKVFGWSENLCLRDWLENWQQMRSCDKTLAGLIKNLSDRCYGHDELKGYSELRSEIVAVLERMPAHRRITQLQPKSILVDLDGRHAKRI